MSKAVSRAFREVINRTSAPEAPLTLLEISHADLATPVRVVNDNQDITSNGETFTALAFRPVFPDDFEKQIPRAQLSVDNVGKGPDGNSLAGWLEASGGGEGATVRMMQVLRSDPDTIEWEVTLDLTNVRVSLLEIIGDMGYTDILNRQGVQLTYRPDIAPGIF